jgi:hypothetical protein
MEENQQLEEQEDKNSDLNTEVNNIMQFQPDETEDSRAV